MLTNSDKCGDDVRLISGSNKYSEDDSKSNSESNPVEQSARK